MSTFQLRKQNFGLPFCICTFYEGIVLQAVNNEHWFNYV